MKKIQKQNKKKKNKQTNKMAATICEMFEI